MSGDSFSIFWRLINFTVLVYILYKVAFRRVYEALAGRGKEITSVFEENSQKREELQKKLNEFENRLAKIDEEIKLIYETFKKDGESQREKSINEAKAHAEKIKEEAKSSVEMLIRQTREEIKKEVSHLIEQATTNIVKENITEKDQKKIIRTALKEIRSFN